MLHRPYGRASPYLADVPRLGNQLELRDAIGGYFTWEVTDGVPTQLVETAASALVDLGHELGRVQTERFGPSGGS